MLLGVMIFVWLQILNFIDREEDVERAIDFDEVVGDGEEEEEENK